MLGIERMEIQIISKWTLAHGLITKGYSTCILIKTSTINWDVGMFYGSNNAYDEDLDICEALTLV